MPLHYLPPSLGVGVDRPDAGRWMGWDGAVVVLRAGESPARGEGRQRVSQGEDAMFEDAPVNAGAVQWPDVDSAFWTVRRMQIKLHRWASEDSTRRFGDLFNLVYDPAFLVHAWERVSSNVGARTPGVDRATVGRIHPPDIVRIVGKKLVEQTATTVEDRLRTVCHFAALVMSSADSSGEVRTCNIEGADTEIRHEHVTGGRSGPELTRRPASFAGAQSAHLQKPAVQQLVDALSNHIATEAGESGNAGPGCAQPRSARDRNRDNGAHAVGVNAVVQPRSWSLRRHYGQSPFLRAMRTARTCWPLFGAASCLTSVRPAA